MNLRPLLILAIAVLAGAAFTVSAQAAAPPAYEGLVPVASRNFDELYLRPDADLAGYRRVMVDPVPVELHPYWLRNMNYTRNVSRWLGPDDARRIAEDASASLYSSVAEAFKARGYEIASAPEPGVLRVSPAISDLYVNAPDRHSPWRTKTFTREAGDAALFLEARDAVTGTLLGRVVHHGRAQEMGRFSRANDVSNRFWFEAVFRRWAVNCVAEFEAGRNWP
ncbi:MAG: DUF3313 family protein [Betaproteobacteria bacterium]|nr:DUF3313 family protein [Betaproteobacteria bacterium]